MKGLMLILGAACDKTPGWQALLRLPRRQGEGVLLRRRQPQEEVLRLRRGRERVVRLEPAPPGAVRAAVSREILGEIATGSLCFVWLWGILCKLLLIFMS